MEANKSLVLLMACLFLISLLGCKGAKKALRIEKLIRSGRVEIGIDTQAQDSLLLYYNGCSSFMMQYQDQVLLHDPFFSNIGPLFITPLQDAISDTVEIHKFYDQHFPGGKDQEGLVKFLLISHSHYDHMLDAPYIYTHILNQDSVQMLGNDGMSRIMALTLQDYPQKQKMAHVISVVPEILAGSKLGRYRKSFNQRIRVLPIKTSHASHFYGIHLYQGVIPDDIREIPHKPGDWKEGINLAFLIDFYTAQDEIAFRIYINGSGSSAPDGFVPKSILQEHPIDIAIICVASHHYVENYPQGLIQNLQPKHLILSHWENFFRPHEQLKKQPMVVPLTNIESFLQKLEESTAKLSPKPGWTLPNVGTKIIIKN